MPTARLLYVDDDPALARLVQRSLGRRGYEVEHVATTAEGLARLAKGGIDIVALDHNLPTGTGLDFLAELQGAARAAAGRLCHRCDRRRVAVAALKAGAADYVAKTTGQEFFELLAAPSIRRWRRHDCSASATAPSARCARPRNAPRCCCTRSTTASPTRWRWSPRWSACR